MGESAPLMRSHNRDDMVALADRLNAENERKGDPTRWVVSADNLTEWPWTVQPTHDRTGALTRFGKRLAASRDPSRERTDG